MKDEEAECVVTRLGEANFDRIKSVTGFLNGIIKRVKLDGPDRGSGKVDMLSRSVRHRLDDLIDDVSAAGRGWGLWRRAGAASCVGAALCHRRPAPRGTGGAGPAQRSGQRCPTGPACKLFSGVGAPPRRAPPCPAPVPRAAPAAQD